MKFSTFIAALALAAAPTLAPAAGEHAHAGNDHRPQHGGVVTATALMDYELVAKPALVQLYLRDHGKPLDISRFSAKLTLLTGSDKQEVALKPVGDKLEAAGSFKVGPGSKAVVVVTRPGKPATTARFTMK